MDENDFWKARNDRASSMFKNIGQALGQISLFGVIVYLIECFSINVSRLSRTTRASEDVGLGGPQGC